MRIKQFVAGLTCMAVLLAPGAALADSTDVQLVVGSALIGTSEEDGQVYINDDGYTMIPLRVVNDAFGYNTQWDQDGSIHITNPDGTVDVSLAIGKNGYTANGVAGTFKNRPTLKNDRTYLPARDFSELYGSIYWDNASRTVWIHQGKETDYQVIGDKLLRGNDQGIQTLTLPEGYVISTKTAADPIVLERTIDGLTYLGLLVEPADFTKPVPLFRVDGDRLAYVADVYGSSSFYVDGDKVYYTDGFGTDGWANPINPKALHVTDLTSGKTETHILDFNVNDCIFTMQDGALIAIEQNDARHTISLEDLAA